MLHNGAAFDWVCVCERRSGAGVKESEEKREGESINLAGHDEVI